MIFFSFFPFLYFGLLCYVKKVQRHPGHNSSAVVCFDDFCFTFVMESLMVFAGKYLIPFTCLWLA